MGGEFVKVIMRKTFKIKMDRETLALLKAEADFQGMSTTAELVAKIIKEYIERLEGEPGSRG